MNDKNTKLQSVKELRDITGISLAKCSDAINNTFDPELSSEQIIEKAFEYLRKTGTKIAADLSTRVTTEGRVCACVRPEKAAIISVNCQTDFVAMSGPFSEFLQFITNAILNTNFTTIDDFINSNINDKSVKEYISNVMVRCGENIVISSAKVIYNKPDSVLGYYIHNNTNGIGAECAVVCMSGSNVELANNIAMHIVGNPIKPIVVSVNDISDEVRARELEIAKSQPQFVSLPADRAELALKGYMNKRSSDLALLSQEYLLEDGKSIETVISGSNIHEFLYMAK